MRRHFGGRTQKRSKGNPFGAQAESFSLLPINRERQRSATGWSTGCRLHATCLVLYGQEPPINPLQSVRDFGSGRSTLEVRDADPAYRQSVPLDQESRDYGQNYFHPLDHPAQPTASTPTQAIRKKRTTLCCLIQNRGTEVLFGTIRILRK